MTIDKGGQSWGGPTFVVEDHPLFGKRHGPLSLIVWGSPWQKHTSRCADLAHSPQNGGFWVASSLSTRKDSARGGAARLKGSMLTSQDRRVSLT